MATIHDRSSYKQHYRQPALYARWLLCGIVLALSGCQTAGGGLNLGSLTNGPAPTSAVPPTQGNQPTAAIPTQATIPTAAGDQATSVPIAPDQQPTEPVIVPTATLPSIVVTPPPAGEAAWNAQKIEVTQFESPRTYNAPGMVLLWWYDPNSAQFVGLGWIKSPIQASGQFRLRWSGLAALAVPYRINGDYGLTLDPTVVDRIRRAGYTNDSIETFIYLAPDIVPQ